MWKGIVLIFVVVFNVVASTELTELCTSDKVGFFVSDGRTCAGYYLCIGGGYGFPSECDPPYWFDEVNQNCGFGSTIDCTLNELISDAE